MQGATPPCDFCVNNSNQTIDKTGILCYTVSDIVQSYDYKREGVIEMKEKKTTRVVLLLLIFSLMLPVLSGCLTLPTGKQEQESESTPVIDTGTQSQEPTVPIDFGKTDVEFTAHQIAGDICMSAWFDLDIKVKDGRAYVGNTLYESIVYTEQYEPTYSQGLLLDAELVDESSCGMMDAFEKIKNHKGCYLLHSSQAKTEYAVYVIDGFYYFLNFTSDYEQVMRVHSTHQLRDKHTFIQSISGLVYPNSRYNGEKIEFATQPHAKAPFSKEIPLNVVIENDAIYLNGVLYEKVTYKDDFKPSYHSSITAHNELLAQNLESIGQYYGRYILETSSTDSNLNQKIAVLFEREQYYFMGLSESGEVMWVRSASLVTYH